MRLKLETPTSVPFVYCFRLLLIFCTNKQVAKYCWGSFYLLNILIEYLLHFPFLSNPKVLDRITIFLNYRDIIKIYYQTFTCTRTSETHQIIFYLFFHGLLTQILFIHLSKCFVHVLQYFFYYIIIDYALNFGHKVHLQCSSTFNSALFSLYFNGICYIKEAHLDF